MTIVSKKAYFEGAMELLSTDGYKALKQATLCKHLKVTTGSFYNYFANWKDFTDQLLANWLSERTKLLVAIAETEPDPRQRLEILRNVSLALPHGAEAAIRVWSHLDPDVAAVQGEVDQRRFDVVYDAMRELLNDPIEAEHVTAWGIYLLVGFEQFQGVHDIGSLEWGFRRLLEVIDAQIANG